MHLILSYFFVRAIFWVFYFPSVVISAGPLLHLWAAEKFCEIQGISDEETLKAIVVGTEFPDIRYITSVPRALTHPIVADIKDVSKAGTPFEWGMKLHAWLDGVRENFILPEVYAAIHEYDEGHSATFLKFIEEEILADEFEGRKWAFCFDEVREEELLFTERQAIVKWHTLIQWSLSLQPSWLLWGQSYRGSAFGVSANTLYNWSYLLPQLKKKEIFTHHLTSLQHFIEEELRRL